MCLTSFPCWLLFLEHLVLLCHIFNFSFFFSFAIFPKGFPSVMWKLSLIVMNWQRIITWIYSFLLFWQFFSDFQVITLVLQPSTFIVLSSLMVAFIIDMKQTVQWKSPDKPTVNFLPSKQQTKLASRWWTQWNMQLLKNPVFPSGLDGDQNKTKRRENNWAYIKQMDSNATLNVCECYSGSAWCVNMKILVNMLAISTL